MRTPLRRLPWALAPARSSPSSRVVYRERIQFPSMKEIGVLHMHLCLFGEIGRIMHPIDPSDRHFPSARLICPMHCFNGETSRQEHFLLSRSTLFRLNAHARLDAQKL